MMKYCKIISYVLCLACLALLVTCNAGAGKGSVGNVRHGSGVTQEPAIVPHPLPAEFYMRLEGDIGGHPVVMNLQRDRSGSYGNYYGQGSWLTLSETEASAGGKFVFSVSGFDMNGTEQFIYLKWTGSGFVGTMRDDSGESQLILREKYPQGSYRFRQGFFNDSLRASGNQGKWLVEFQEGYLQADGNSQDYLWINRSLKLGDGLDGMLSWELAVREKARERLAVLLGNLSSADRDSALMYANYFDMSKNTILYNGRSFLVMAKGYSIHTGGLHPNYGTNMDCYDLRDKRRLRLRDILRPGTDLSPLLESCFRQQYGLRENQSLKEVLFDAEIYENQNFYFNDKGLAFKYNTYEIAPYGEGEIDIFIPFSRISHLLRPAFLKRIRP